VTKDFLGKKKRKKRGMIEGDLNFRVLDHEPHSLFSDCSKGVIMEWSERGQQHLDRARHLHNGCIDALKNKDLEKAELLLADALQIRRRVLPNAHLQIIATMELYVHILRLRGRNEETFAALQELASMKTQCFGKFHVETEAALCDLLSLCESMGKRELAEQLSAAIWSMRCMTGTERQAMNFDDTLTRLRETPKYAHSPEVNETTTSFDSQDVKPRVRTSTFLDDMWLSDLLAKAKMLDNRSKDHMNNDAT
jgi:hypothetical protein